MSRVFFFFFLPFLRLISPFFFFNDTATTEIYTLSLHDALPISPAAAAVTSRNSRRCIMASSLNRKIAFPLDRKSTRLNSSHDQISYAVFCLKKKKKHRKRRYGFTTIDYECT